MDKDRIIPEGRLEGRRKRQELKLTLIKLDDLNVQASEIGEEFSTLAESDTVEAIQELPSFIQRVRDINPDRVCESIAGGPIRIGLFHCLMRLENSIQSWRVTYVKHSYVSVSSTLMNRTISARRGISLWWRSLC